MCLAREPISTAASTSGVPERRACQVPEYPGMPPRGHRCLAEAVRHHLAQHWSEGSVTKQVQARGVLRFDVSEGMCFAFTFRGHSDGRKQGQGAASQDPDTAVHLVNSLAGALMQ